MRICTLCCMIMVVSLPAASAESPFHPTLEKKVAAPKIIHLDSTITGKGLHWTIRDIEEITAGPSRGKLLVATWGMGLFLMKEAPEGHFHMTRLEVSTEIPEGRINEIFQTPDGIWLGTFRGIFKLNPMTLKLMPEPKPQMAPYPVHGIWTSQNGTIIAGTTGNGLLIKNPLLNEWITLGNEHNIHCNWINSIYGSPEKLLIGTLRGVYTLNITELSKTNPIPKISFMGGAASVNPINCARPFNSDGELIGTSNSGLMHHSNNGKWRVLNIRRGLPSNEITDIEPSDKGSCLIATRKGAVKINSEMKITDKWDGDSRLPDIWIKAVSNWGKRIIAGTSEGMILELLNSETSGGNWRVLFSPEKTIE